MSSCSGDRTVNKLALCSAIFAGVAYVGYSVVKQAFKRTKDTATATVKGRNDDDDDEEHALDVYAPRSRRIYLRRLSGSETSASAETLMGSLDPDGARLILRPLSVQARIRELNLRARHFAETVLAVQLQDDGERRRAAIAHTRSLETSPTRSGPRILCPIDITHLGSSRCSSVENLSHASSSGEASDVKTNGVAPPNAVPPSPTASGHRSRDSLRASMRKRRSRRATLNQNPDLSAVAAAAAAAASEASEEEALEAEGERLLDEREAELRRRLQGWENGTIRVLTPYEAKSLVALLHAKDCEMLEKALVTVSNSATFTSNQDNLRDAGCLIRLQHLIVHSDRRVQLAALQAVSNLALNTSNQKEMGNIVPLLLPIVETEDSEGKNEHLTQQTLFTLTNIAALSDWHKQFWPSLNRLLALTQSHSAKIRMQSLRLLVNLSTNEEMVPHLLAAKAPGFIWAMLDENEAEDQLLRAVTLLANLVCTAHKQNLDPTWDLPLDDKTVEPDTMYTHLYGKESREDVLEHLEYLMESHPLEDIRVKARMIHKVIGSNGQKQDNRL